MRPKLLTAVPIVLLALAACGGTSPGRTTSSTPSPGATATTQPTSPAATPAPTATATSPATVTACPSGFTQGPAQGGSSVGGRVVTVRTGSQQGYDRFVIEFSGSVPGYQVAPQPTATFTNSPKGDSVTLDGTAGVLITIQPVQDWTSYTGPTGMNPAYAFLRQVKQVQNFEAVQQWALGVTSPACLRVSTMTSPARLVVDLAASS